MERKKSKELSNWNTSEHDDSCHCLRHKTVAVYAIQITLFDWGRS